VARDVVRIFPNPEEVRNANIINRDQNLIVIDRGKDKQLIAGMIGYVVYTEDSIRVEDFGRSRHYSYLGEFIITEVFNKSSTGILLYPYDVQKNKTMDDFEWDVDVGDAVVIK
jgi:hypothetical protein